jgi:hypothetical protein
MSRFYINMERTRRWSVQEGWARSTKIKIKTVMNKFIVENSDRSHRKPDKALLYNGTY